MSVAQVKLRVTVISSSQAQVAVLPFVTCMTLNKLFHFSVLLEFHLHNNNHNNYTHLLGFSEGIGKKPCKVFEE